jgi:hypothetical protein
MHWLGILESDYWDAHDDIRSTLADPGFDGDIDDAMELQLQAFADSIATVLPIDRHHAAPIASAADRLRRSPVDPKRSNDPWWFTYEDELHRENEQLPDPSNPLQKSGYVAGLRASLGLKHDSEQLDDHEAAGPGIVARRTIAAISFRIYIQFSMHIAEGDKDSLYQPSLFSGGYPHLFLSEPRKSAGGRTVRLKDKLCACPPDCLCAREGLPEGIIPEQIVLATREHRVRGVYLGLHRDLSRYSVPPCDEIRRRCALAA